MPSNLQRESLEKITEKLRDSIEEKLKLAGINYRIFYRLKSEHSLLDKLQRNPGKYGTEPGQKLIQDMIGIRVVLYYVEDIAICRDILFPDVYQLEGSWQEYKTEAVEFRSQKTNGVFSIPQSYLSKEEWNALCGGLPIDRTFELQLRTVFFEGWHEIEHEIVYKEFSVHHSNFWEENKKLKRKLSSVLATLELCDWTIEDVAREAAEKCRELGNWDLALKSHFRLAFAIDRLNEKACTYLSEQEELAGQIFSISKKEIVQMLMNDHNREKLSTNRLLYLLLQSGKISDDGLASCLLDELPPEEGKYHFPAKKLCPLHSDYAFYQSLELPEDALGQAAELVYAWVLEHMEGLPVELPKMLPVEPVICDRMIGHHLKFQYEPEKGRLFMELWHISDTEAGVIWHVIVNAKHQQGHLRMVVENICEEIRKRHTKVSRPKFVEEINKRVGFIDAGILCKPQADHYLSEDRKVTQETSEFLSIDRLSQLVRHRERALPVVALFPVSDEEDSFEHYTIEYGKLHRYLSGLCHVVKLKSAKKESFLERFELKAVLDSYGNPAAFPEGTDGLSGGVAYWHSKEERPVFFPKEQIQSTRFEEKIFEVASGEKEYNLAFRKLLMQRVRSEFANISPGNRQKGEKAESADRLL